MTLRSLSARGSLLVLVLAVSICAPGQRVVAVGDVHGDAGALAGILQHAGVIDADRHWAGGSTILVQVGDLLDRGDHGREVLDLMMALEKEAPKSGGRVIALLGNHEFMNLVGDLRYVTPAGFAEFSAPDTAKIRSNAYQRYCAWEKRRAKRMGYPAVPEAEASWNARHPLGFVEQRGQFSAKEKYGRWLRQRAAVAQVGDVIFLHGGIDPALDVTGVAELNERIQAELRTFDELVSDLEARGIILPFFTLQEMLESAAAELKAGVSDAQLRTRLEYLVNYFRWYGYRDDGPLWFRGYSQWPEQEGTERLTALLARSGARHVVVGHTPQPEYRIRQRFGGQVFLIDTGISRVYAQGRPSALEIENGKFTAIYADERRTLLDRSPPQSQEAGAGDRRSEPPPNH
ncbi:MAG TPA: metallophosphoesterase [Terriglobales bacterium]|nr:metallophosphoesterase [Terriglobales bacterium]